MLTLFDNYFKKGLFKGRLTNEIIKRAIHDAEISDNRNGSQEGYEQALYPRPHDRLYLISYDFWVHKLEVQYR